MQNALSINCLIDEILLLYCFTLGLSVVEGVRFVMELIEDVKKSFQFLQGRTGFSRSPWVGQEIRGESLSGLDWLFV
jgi:hypothetical protein